MRLTFRMWVFLVMLGLVASGGAWAQSSGQVAYLSGTLTAKKPDGSPRLLAEKSVFENGDVLTTAQDSYARLRFSDGSEIALRPNTTLSIDAIRFDQADEAADGFVVNLIKGGMRAVTGLIGKRSKHKVSYGTPVATVGIRGTHFGLMLCQGGDCAGLRTLGGAPLKDGLHADVADGSVAMTNRAGSLVVDAGQFAYVAGPDAPPESVDAQNGFRVQLPLSVMFDENAQLWSEGSKCSACVMH